MGVSLGLGLTNDCDLNCPHCYRPQGEIRNLTLKDVTEICETLDVGSVGLGTGENGLNPQYLDIMNFFWERRIPVSLATNGYTVENSPDELLQGLSDVEFSVDFPSEREQDDFRGRGNWNRVRRNVERCKKLGLEVSFLAVLMSINYDKLGDLAGIAGSMGCNLRVNVFQPNRNRAYLPSYREYWEAFHILFEEAAVVSCTEPLVNTFSGLNSLRGSPCGRGSIRITPFKHVLPCVYWPENGVTLDRLSELRGKVIDTDSFVNVREVAPECTTCEFLDNCRGGCRSRNRLLDKSDQPDHFCPLQYGDSKRLSPTVFPGGRLLRSNSICTTIVRA